LKKANPNTKVGISVGGWFDSSYFAPASADKYRIQFAKSLARYTAAFGFDALDIDWEYPTTEHCNEDVPTASLPAWATMLKEGKSNPCKAAKVNYDPDNADNIIDCFGSGTACQYPYRIYDPVNMVLLFRDLRKELDALGPNYELTSALRADPDWIEERMPADMMAKYLDQFNDMTYDYNAAYN